MSTLNTSVPTGWTSMRLKWTVSRTTNGVWGDEADGGVNDIACIRVADFDRTSFSVCTDNLTMRSVAPAQRNSRILKRGNLLLEKSGGGEKQPVGAVVIFNHDFPAICSNFIARVDIADEHCPRYLVYLHAHLYHCRITTRSIKQTTGIQNLDEEMYLDEVVGLPDRATQRAIADFLDRKTAAIDALIEKKERLIALLAEKRAALIHQAVTKGLDPNVPMKDSGVPWIGQIPAHWDAKRIKFLCKLESGHTPSRSEPAYWVPDECTIPWVSLNDTKTLASSDFISDTHTKISPTGMRNSSAHIIDEGAVVFTRDATIGLAAITTRPMAVSQHVIAWVCGPEIDSSFLLRVINAMVQELDRLTFGATLKTIGMADVRSLRTPTPPLSEQLAIASHVNEQLAKHDGIVARLRHQIAKLKEYRQSLITAAVTGQLPIPEPPS